MVNFVAINDLVPIGGDAGSAPTGGDGSTGGDDSAPEGSSIRLEERLEERGGGGGGCFRFAAGAAAVDAAVCDAITCGADAADAIGNDVLFFLWYVSPCRRGMLLLYSFCFLPNLKN